MKTLHPDLRKPITTIVDAKAFIALLFTVELTWHFDDDPVDCLHETNPLVSREDAEFLGEQRDALYDFEWGEFDCPIGYLLTLMKEL